MMWYSPKLLAQAEQMFITQTQVICSGFQGPDAIWMCCLPLLNLKCDEGKGVVWQKVWMGGAWLIGSGAGLVGKTFEGDAELITADSQMEMGVGLL